MAKPALLFLTQRLPYPPIKGEKIRQWHILNHLARWYEVHLGCLIDDKADIPHAATVRALCRDMHAAPLDRRIAKLTCMRGLLSGEALSVTFFRDRGLRRWIETVMTEVKPELTFVISSNMAPYILDLPRTGQRIVDLVDVDSEKFRAYAETAAFPMRHVYQREASRVAALERRIAAECDWSIFVSDAEAALFKTMVPERASQILGISNGVDHRYFDPAPSHPAAFAPGGAAFVFTGTMDYLPNVDAVTWFATGSQSSRGSSMATSFTVTRSPSLTTSLTRSTRSSDSSDTWTRPSLPGMICTKAPKSRTLTTGTFS